MFLGRTAQNFVLFVANPPSVPGAESRLRCTSFKLHVVVAVDVFTFPPLNVNWTFSGGAGKDVDVSPGNFWTKGN